MNKTIFAVLSAFFICGFIISASIGLALVYVYLGKNPQLSLLLGVAKTGLFICTFGFIPIALKVMSDGEMTLRKVLRIAGPTLGFFLGLLAVHHFAPQFFFRDSSLTVLRHFSYLTCYI